MGCCGGQRYVAYSWPIDTICRCFCGVTSSTGSPKLSFVFVFTSTNTTVPASSATISISPKRDAIIPFDDEISELFELAHRRSIRLRCRAAAARWTCGRRSKARSAPARRARQARSSSASVAVTRTRRCSQEPHGCSLRELAATLAVRPASRETRHRVRSADSRTFAESRESERRPGSGIAG